MRLIINQVLKISPLLLLGTRLGVANGNETYMKRIPQ
jgi:hypothetical protein